MGQLEKYGLYVLCLVIFLILGVTIWGGGELPQTGKRVGPGPGTELNANTRIAATNPNAGGPSNAVRPTNNPTPPSDVLSLLQPAAPPTDPKKAEAKPVDATAQKPNGDANKSGNEAGKSAKAPAADPTKPPAESTRPSHKVARGETFDSIAKDKLGSASLRTEIARLNPRVDPSKLQVGQELVLPTATEIAALTAKTKPAAKQSAAEPAASGEKKSAAEPGTYTIAKGDTFELIARRELGSSKRVNELRELNSDIDPTRLRIGMQIKLPKK